MINALLIALTAAPGLFAWWTGRQLLARRDDPVLPELILERTRRVTQVAAGVVVGVMLLAPERAFWHLPLTVLGTMAGGFTARRALFEETWNFGVYLVWTWRFLLALGGFWILLMIAPSVIHLAGPWRWLVAAGFGLALIAWNFRYPHLFRWLVGARALDDPELAQELAPVLERSGIAPPRLFRFGFPGGHIANAFAFPGEPAVVFTEDLLTLLGPGERAAIFAHEVAHLEHWTRARLHRAHAAVLGAVALAVIGLPLLLARWPEWLEYANVLWLGAVAGALALRVMQHQAHETESDRRAVVLCGDGDAVARALTKLTVAARLPRRWAMDRERTASHPSLARRIQAIRAAAGTPPPSLERPIMLATTKVGSFVIFDEHSITWLEGVPPGARPDPATLDAQAAGARTLRYAELSELRVRFRLGGAATLVATDGRDQTWSVRLRPAAVATAQRVLDIVDLHLGPPVRLVPSTVLRGLGLLMMLLSLASPARLILMASGLLAVALPGRAVLPAVIAAALGTVLVDVQRSAPAITPTGAALVLAAGGALWLLIRGRVARRHLVWQAVTVAVVLAAATGLAWVVGVRELDGRLLEIVELGDHQPNALVGLLALGATLLVLPRAWTRWAGALVLVVGLTFTGLTRPIAHALGIDPAGPALGWVNAAVDLKRQARVGGVATGLRLSPSATYYAARLVRRGGEATVFRIADFENPGRTVLAEDVAFVDDARVLVLARRLPGFELRVEGLNGALEEPWLVELPDVGEPVLTADPAGTWRLAGIDPQSDEAVTLSGKVGSEQVVQRKWKPAQGELDQIWPVVDGTAYFAVSSPAPHSRSLMLLSALAALPWPVERQIWSFGADGRRRLVTFRSPVRCLSTSAVDGSLICLAHGLTRTRVWRVKASEEGAGTVAIIAGAATRSAVGRDGRVVALTGPDAAAVVDPVQGRALRVRFPQTAGKTTEAIPAGNGLAVLRSSQGEATVSLYEVR